MTVRWLISIHGPTFRGGFDMKGNTHVKAAKGLAKEHPTIFKQVGGSVLCQGCGQTMRATTGRMHSCLTDYMEANVTGKAPSQMPHTVNVKGSEAVVEEISLTKTPTKKATTKKAPTKQTNTSPVIEEVLLGTEKAPVKATKPKKGKKVAKGPVVEEVAVQGTGGAKNGPKAASPVIEEVATNGATKTKKKAPNSPVDDIIGEVMVEAVEGDDTEASNGPRVALKRIGLKADVKRQGQYFIIKVKVPGTA
jgi:hypothetical protein